MTPSMVLLSATASSSLLRTRNAAPSAGTKPSAPLWKGRDFPVRLNACSALKPTCSSKLLAPLTPPATITSAVRSWSRSHASLIAYKEDAQAASRAVAPPVNPSALDMTCAGNPDMNRLRQSILWSLPRQTFSARSVMVFVG